MAILEQPMNTSNPFADVVGDELAPAGTYAATIIDIKDEFGVTRQKYQSTEMETVDLTCFLFGFRDAAGQAHRISSKRMRISGNEKSNLFAFLKSMLGQAPRYGWDYCELKGKQCLVTVEHVQRRDGVGVFAAIAALSPLPAGMGMARSQMTEFGGQTTPPPEAQAATPAVAAVPVVTTPAAAPAEVDDPIPF
jgi:hypothetical protein